MCIPIENTPMIKHYFEAHIPNVSPLIIQSHYRPIFNMNTKKWKDFKFRILDKHVPQDLKELTKKVKSKETFDMRLETLDSAGVVPNIFQFERCIIKEISFDDYCVPEINVTVKFDNAYIK